MPDTYTDEKGNLIIDLGSSSRGHNTLAERARKAAFARVDLGSGYPIEMMWITKDGRRIAIPNMDDEHIQNTVRHLRKISETLKHRAAIGKLLASVLVSADMHIAPFPDDDDLDQWYNAQTEEAQRIWDMPTNDFLREFVPQYEHLLTEMYKRKLLI